MKNSDDPVQQLAPRVTVAGELASGPVSASLRAGGNLAELRRWIAFRDREARSLVRTFKCELSKDSPTLAYWAGYRSALDDLEKWLKSNPLQDSRARSGGGLTRSGHTCDRK